MQEASAAISEMLQAAVYVSPWGVILDTSEAVTGENTFKPGVQLEGSDRLLKAASAAAQSGVVGAIMQARKASKLATTIRENYKNGKAFEKEIQAFLGDVAKNKQLYKATLKSVKVRGTIPDFILVTANTMIEVKRMSSLSLTTQLEEQLRSSMELGMRYRIITSGVNDAASISQPLKDLLNLHPNATVEIYDAATRRLRVVYRGILQ